MHNRANNSRPKINGQAHSRKIRHIMSLKLPIRKISLTYSQAIDMDTGLPVLSKWWMTGSCDDALRRENQWRLEALAKARAVRSAMKAAKAGQEQATPKEIKRVCLRCRRIEMRGKQQYCEKCYAKRRNETRRGSEVAEIANSPIGAEALIKAEFEGGYRHSQMQMRITEALA